LHFQGIRIWWMCPVYVAVVQLIPQLIASEVVRTTEYQSKTCSPQFTTHCEIPVRFLTFTFQLSVRITKMLTKKVNYIHW
jgi:hypothetical protein